MKTLPIAIFLSLSLLSCNEKNKAFDSFDYSFSGTFSELYSIKFTESDTVFVRQYWIRRRFNDSISKPQNNTNYYALINQKEKLKLFDYIAKINLFKYKSEYYKDYCDGSEYAINIEKDFKSKIIFVHSYEAPKKLDSLSLWINNIKQSLLLKETKKELFFGSAEVTMPPIPPPPPPLPHNE
ncbi:hypothetical protein SD960_08660 [Flavobacterium sp. MMLR14_040]|uniref:hypothetical protein n=1 Tax=Flavobacterium sp. MMLR14_040 TaxID=3093843 RepID=UPI00298F8BB0|nr:hypothetical protein [Flavobacterium sp. MMLR14_040]MDW8850158.1 hypothetical protein [Flavobacterium sp. MMLR14_040]